MNQGRQLKNPCFAGQERKQFTPKISLAETECLLNAGSRLQETPIHNDQVYKLVKKLVSLFSPTYEDEYDRKWADFYLPLKRRTRLMSIPFMIMEYKKEFFPLFYQMGSLQISPGTEKVDKTYRKIFAETLRFVPLIKKTGGAIIKKTVPYDFRSGKIKGKYVMERTMPLEQKKDILSHYETHLRKNLRSQGCSLNEYLGTAAICYKAAFGGKTAGLRPLEMYKGWADNRHGGMLEIDPDSRSKYSSWYRSGRWAGCHPFEIVFSMIDHGIHLYPPSEHDSWKYQLRVTNYMYAEAFVSMAEALAREDVPFMARDFENVLDYLAGETYFTVNDYSDHYIRYYDSREDRKMYFKHIEWKNLKVPEFHSDSSHFSVPAGMSEAVGKSFPTPTRQCRGKARNGINLADPE